MSDPADKDLRDFCLRHGINVLDTNKRAHRYNKMTTRYFISTSDYNIAIADPIAIDTEPLYTIEITLSELEKIAKFEAEVFNHMQNRGHYNLFEIMMEQKLNEKILREKYSAVNKAYEHYSLMLALASGGELDAGH